MHLIIPTSRLHPLIILFGEDPAFPVPSGISRDPLPATFALPQCRNCDYQQEADNSCIYVNKITHEVE